MLLPNRLRGKLTTDADLAPYLVSDATASVFVETSRSVPWL
jgi:hypothetical protein